MQTIPAEKILEASNRFSSLSERESKALAHRMKKEQPYVMVYLTALDEDLFDEEDRGALNEHGALAWYVLSAEKPLRQVTDRDLEQAEEANIKMLQDMEESSEIESTDAMTRLFQEYNQQALLGAMLELLMAGHEEEPDLAPENIGMALIYLKTVIDCLDQ